MSIALSPLYKVTSLNPDVLNIKDLTGQWTPVVTPGGWDPTGLQNPKASEATAAEIRIAKRNSDGTFGTETTINVYPSFPSDSGGSINIDSSDAGQGGEYADGVYKITYMVQGIWVSNANTPFLTTLVKYVPIIPAICACNEAAIIESSKCTCNCEKIKGKTDKINYYLRLLCAATECRNLNDMQKFIDILTKICNCNGC